MNLYTRCLLEIQDGRRREALRWLCRALSYNLHLPGMLLAGKKETHHEGTWGVAMGSEHEAVQYLRENVGWLRKQPSDFLRRLMATSSFVRRLDRAIELKAALDSVASLPPGEARSATVDDLYAIFDEDHIPKILEECRDAW